MQRSEMPRRWSCIKRASIPRRPKPPNGRSPSAS